MNLNFILKIFKKNPIPEILNNWEWEMLNGRKLLNHVAVRDYLIVKETSGKKITANIINGLAEKYNLENESIRKLIYSKRKII